ncbi:amino acid kinase family protein, partial [Vibrio parahaemolyticus V-223/04]
PTTLWHVVS